jgi:hypothetical protein
MLRITTIILFLLLSAHSYSQETKYQKNLKIAAEIFLAKQELPDSVLLRLVPVNYDEFGLLYSTTSPDNRMQNTGFFSSVTQQIFNKVIVAKNEMFYLPCLQLASFADGEFGEDFTDKLEVIINLDNNKFCNSIKGKSYADHNPIKYFADQLNCK